MSTLNDINPRVPFVDANGFLSPYWMRWLQDLHVRTGGTTAPSNTDLAVDLPEDAGLEEMRATLFAQIDSQGQTPPYQEMPRIEHYETQIREMAEQIAVLRKEIDGLRQGLSA